MAGGDNFYEEERDHLGGKTFYWNSMIANTSFQLSGYSQLDAFRERIVQFALMLYA